MREDPWSRIEPAPDVVGLRIEGRHPLHVYWTRRQDGACGVLFKGFPVHSLPGEMPRLREVCTEWNDNDPTSLALFLEDAAHKEVFHLLCRDIVDASSRAADPGRSIAAVVRRLDHWHEMLAAGRGNELTEPEVRGLIGELTVLDRIGAHLGLEGAIQAWVAPDDHPQDFALPLGLIEVKSRLSGSRQTATISSLEQLESTDQTLLLVAVECTPDDQAPSLNALVGALLERAATAGGGWKDRLDLALLRRGYAHSPRYESQCYRVSDMRAFAVATTFPRLTRSTTDMRVRSATYCLDLTGLSEFEVDTLPAIAALSRQVDG
jgi:hypothetical protein